MTVEKSYFNATPLIYVKDNGLRGHRCQKLETTFSDLRIKHPNPGPFSKDLERRWKRRLDLVEDFEKESFLHILQGRVSDLHHVLTTNPPHTLS